jgi:flagellar hook-length control protein FliK
MVGEVNVIATLGPVGAGPSPQETDEGAVPVDFAALLDGAAAAMPSEPGTKPVKDAGAAKTLMPVFIAEWCLGGFDASTAVESEQFSGEPVVEADESSADTDDDDDENSAPALVGVMNIDWLLAQPKRMVAAVCSEESGDPAAAEPAAVETAPVAAATSAPVKAATSEGAPVATDSKVVAAAFELPKQADAKAEVVDRAEPVVEPRTAAVPNVKAERATKAVEAKPSTETPHATAAAAVNVPDAAPVANAVAAAPAARPTESERPSSDALKSNGASSRLAKAIERVFGGSEAAPHVKPSSDAGDTAGNNGSTFSSSPHENAAANVAPALRAAATAGAGPAFTVHVTPEVSKAVEVAAAMVDAPVPTAAHIPEADTVRQLVQTMRMQFRDGIGDAVVRLRPEHLGEVSISLRVDQQSVSATVHAEVAAVRQWLESQEASLRSGLAEQGLHLEKFVVREDPQQQQQQADQEEARRRNRQARRQRDNEGEPRFEITV